MNVPERGDWNGIGRLRRFAFYGLTGLFVAVVSLDFIHHLTDLPQDGGVHHVHVLMHAVATGSLLVGMAAQLRSPAQHVAALQQGLVASVAGAALAAATGHLAVLPVAFILVGGIVSFLHPSRAEILRPGHVNRALLVVTVLAAGPVLAYAAGQFRLQIEGASPIHSSRGHFAVMGQVTVSLLLLLVVAALGARGSRVPAWTSGVGAVVLGGISIVAPSDASSLGVDWGTVAIAGGMIVLGATEWQRRRSHPQPVARAAGRARPVG